MRKTPIRRGALHKARQSRRSADAESPSEGEDMHLGPPAPNSRALRPCCASRMGHTHAHARPRWRVQVRVELERRQGLARGLDDLLARLDSDAARALPLDMQQAPSLPSVLVCACARA